MGNRCLLVAVLILTFSAEVSAQKRTFDLLTASIADIQAAVAAGALTYEKLVQLYLNRIDAYDKKGPRLNAVIQINNRALEVARSLDEERKSKGLRSPLHGIPIAVKDNIDVKDMPSAGETSRSPEPIRKPMRPSFDDFATPAPSFLSKPIWMNSPLAGRD